MKIAILGRQPAIGIAELESVFGGENIRILGTHAALVDAEKLNISHFGSILKSGEVAFEVNSTDWREISKKIVSAFERDFANTTGKITLGISAYGLLARGADIAKTGTIIKSKLREKGVSVRVISSKDSALSTAVSHNNKLGLSDKKIEILAVRGGQKTVVALSEGAQNITAYARRDQNRPKRDAFVGMLPPKLAQTMLNLALGDSQPQIILSKNQKIEGKNFEILDPFCGTGTVLQEAALKGLTAHGTDLSEKMVEFSKENSRWVEETFRPYGQIGDIFTADATEQKWDFAPNLTSVICETYLGQPFSAPPSPKKLTEVRENCNRIISNFLKNLASQIPEGTQICIAVPAWKTQNGEFSHLPLVDFLPQLGYNRKEFLRVKPQDLIYYRENQVVARELLVLIRSKNVKS
ncbi:MAG: hypothetical protein Q4A21_00890 [bacterium]|nr:hypothetical protein [bacterium]